jgi:hypothetical protein
MNTRAGKKTIAAKAAPTVLVLFCLLILAWALLRANAAWHFFAAQTIAQPLFETGTGSPADFAEAEFRVNTALSRFPDNPDYLDFAGRLKILSAGQPGVVGSQRRELLQSAAGDFRRALSVRPTWPYSWANLLSVKDKLRQVDAEFNEAINAAAETGPWEPRVQMQIIDSGLRHWDELASAERELVRVKTADALRIQPREAFAAAKSFGRPDLLCELDSDQVQIQNWCNEVGAISALR